MTKYYVYYKKNICYVKMKNNYTNYFQLHTFLGQICTEFDHVKTMSLVKKRVYFNYSCQIQGVDIENQSFQNVIELYDFTYKLVK